MAIAQDGTTSSESKQVASDEQPVLQREPYFEPENRALFAIKPCTEHIEYDTPSDEDISTHVTTRTIDIENIRGIELITRDRRVLRRFIDTNNDGKLDQWIFFRNGREVYRDADTDFDGKADVGIHRIPLKLSSEGRDRLHRDERKK